MIYRYGVECPGCQARLLLRVSVGVDIEQPFFVTCGRCHTLIKGKQVIWYKPTPGARIEFDHAKQIDARSGTFDETITLHPDLPARVVASAMTDTGGSPFSYLSELLGGEGLEQFMGRVRLFRNIIAEDGAGLRRLADFYLRGDWARFCDEGRRLFAENWPEPKTEWQYHDVLPRVFHLAFGSLAASDRFLRFVEEWNAFLVGDKANLPVLKAFYSELAKGTSVIALQRQVLVRFDFVATHRASLLPALPVEFYKQGIDVAVKELRLLRDDFDILKGHYVDCYELAHKVLTIMVGSINIVKRGSPDAFDQTILDQLAKAGMGNFKKIANLEAFDTKPNGPKRALLSGLPATERVWNELLDRDLRNAVGHADAHHDLQTGMVHVEGKPYCSYIEFVARTLRLTECLLCLLHVLKMCRVYPLLQG